MAAFPILQALSPGIPAVANSPEPGSPGEGFGVEMSARRAWPPPGAPPPGAPTVGPEGEEAATFEPNALSKQPDFLLLDPAKTPSFFSETDLVETISPAESRPLLKGPTGEPLLSESSPNPNWVIAASALPPVPQFDPSLLVDLTPLETSPPEHGSRPIPSVADEVFGARPNPTPSPQAPVEHFDRSFAAGVQSVGSVDPTLDRAGTAQAQGAATLPRSAPEAPAVVDGQRTAPVAEPANPQPPSVDPTLDRAGTAAAAGQVARQVFGSRPAAVSDDAPPASRGEVTYRTESDSGRVSTGTGETAKPAVHGSRIPPAAFRTEGPVTIMSRTVVDNGPTEGAKSAVLGTTQPAPAQADPAKKLEADSAVVLQKSAGNGPSVQAAAAAGPQADAGTDRREPSEDDAFMDDAFMSVDRAQTTADTDRAGQFAARVVEAAAARPVELPTRLNPLSARLSMEVLVQIADRIEMLAAKSARREVVVHLEPEDLGSVTMVVRRNGTSVEASVYASQEQVRAAIDQNRAGLTQQLESRGLSLGALTVGSQSAEARSNGDGANPAFGHPIHPNFGSDSNGASARPATIDQVRASIRKASGLDLWT